MMTDNFSILLADDDPKMLKRLSSALQKGGYQVTTASNSATILKLAARRKKLALVILELEADGNDGVETCRHIREFSDVPVIILARNPEESKVVQGLRYGADDFISKPFSIHEFMARIKAVLSCAGFAEHAPPGQRQYGIALN